VNAFVYATSTTAEKPIISLDGLNGRVGIGTSTPGSQLSIQGTCVDTGAGCADIAELYPSSEPVDMGDIVAVDTHASGSVKKAIASDVVLGVVSTQPAITIEGSALQFLSGVSYKNDPRKPAIALAGRVPVNVSTEGGVIRIGDRISASSISGVGKKAVASETTVGIALESFDGADATTTAMADDKEVHIGKILVFVSLGHAALDDGMAALAQSNVRTPTNAWSVDQQSGKVNVSFFGDVNLNGNARVDIGRLSGNLGKWTLSEEGTLVVPTIVTDDLRAKNATIGTRENPNGITVYDQDTGEPYCVGVKSGEWAKVSGQCGETIPAPSLPTTPHTEPPSDETIEPEEPPTTDTESPSETEQEYKEATA